MAAEDPKDDVEAFLTERHPKLADLALWVREQVHAAEPDLTERVYRGWDGIGFRHPDTGYGCAIYPRDDHVQLLFEHGARLDDPDDVFAGDGTQTRYIPITNPDPALRETIARYVNDAVAERLLNR